MTTAIFIICVLNLIGLMIVIMDRQEVTMSLKPQELDPILFEEVTEADIKPKRKKVSSGRRTTVKKANA